MRWSDGSLQLMLGDEVLDVLRQDLTSNNTYLYCMRNIIQVSCVRTRVMCRHV